MRLTALLALLLAGCSFYVGGDDTQAADPLDEGPSGPAIPEEPVPTVPPPVPPPPRPPSECGSPEVHVFGIYETSSDHGTVGEAHVSIDRPGDHILALSAYEETRWQVEVGPGAAIRAVYLLGYEPQTVDLPDVPVTQGSGCGYSYPYNGGGCDTIELLSSVKERAGRGITTFHGCYQASQWTLLADGAATSNCNTDDGYEVDELLAGCIGSDGWESVDFETLSPPSCDGPRFIRRDERYDVWVGAILCGDRDRYKLYMSEARTEPFLEIADYAGHGQDHCELVNPAFRIPDEDDITSGGCTDCEVGPLVDVDGIPVYARARFGEPFELVQARFWADLTTTFYACGVAIP